MKANFLAFAAGMSILCSACGVGQELSHAEAREWVEANRNELLKLAATIEQCDGSQDNEFNRIFADGTAFTDHCDTDSKDIVGQLGTLDIAAVAYYPQPDRDRLSWIEFDLYLAGIVTSGTSISVTWHPESQDCKSEETREEGFEFIKKPLFPDDCEWIFESMSN